MLSTRLGRTLLRRIHALRDSCPSASRIAGGGNGDGRQAGSPASRAAPGFLKSEPRFGEILSKRRCPLIATIRRREEGGKWSGSEERRHQLLRAAIVDGFDYVDLEEDIASQIPRFGTTRRIISHHNMVTMPHHLPQLWERMAKLDPDIIKIAGRAKKGI